MYINGILVWGEEPDGTKAVPGADLGATDNPTPDPEPDTTPDPGTKPEVDVWGDANCDGTVLLNDAVLVLQALGNPDVYGVDGSGDVHITEQGKLNCDVYENGSGLTNMDALSIQKYILKLITELPEK